MVFKSKVDLSLAFIIWGSAFVCYVPIFTADGLVIGLVLGTVMTAGLSYFWFNTKYTVKDEQLIVHGVFRNQVIPITSIQTIAPTRNLLSAPALSIDRLEVTYGQYDFVLISPKEREQFIALLLEKNPNIALR